MRRESNEVCGPCVASHEINVGSIKADPALGAVNSTGRFFESHYGMTDRLWKAAVDEMMVNSRKAVLWYSGCITFLYYRMFKSCVTYVCVLCISAQSVLTLLWFLCLVSICFLNTLWDSAVDITTRLPAGRSGSRFPTVASNSVI